MSDREFNGWIDFYNRHPFDDRHRYHRPALIAGNLLREGVDVNVLLDWLEDGPVKGPQEVTPAQADDNTLRAFGLSRPKGK